MRCVLACNVRTMGVLNTRRPPGRSQPLMRRSAPAVSAKYIMPLEHSAASKLPAGSRRSSTSPTSNRTLRDPSSSAFRRACKRFCWGRRFFILESLDGGRELNKQHPAHTFTR